MKPGPRGEVTEKPGLSRIMVLFVAISPLMGCGPIALGPSPSGANMPVPEAARASLAGKASAGFWALREGTLFFSSDGAAWRTGPQPIPERTLLAGQTVFVLDAHHAWAMVDTSTVAFTVDGASSWQTAELPDTCSDWVGLAFADPNHGVLLCVNPGRDTDTVLLTANGGHAWSVMNTAARTPSGRLGTQVAISPNSWIWAVAASQDTGTQAMAGVSRDGGVTWSDVRLPGLAQEYHGGDSVEPLGPPEFTEGGTGALAVSADRLANGTAPRIWEADGRGISWREEAGPPNDAPYTAMAFVGPGQWLALRSSGAVTATMDGGAVWTTRPATGLPSPLTAHALVFSDPQHGITLVEVPSPSHEDWLELLSTADAGVTWRPVSLSLP
jgi:photosystem II stability/assembly factor-like uncharacterized protein